MRLPEEVAQSPGYRVLEGVEEQLPRLCRDGFLLGITTGALVAAAHIKLARANLNRFFSFGGYGSDSADRGELTRKAIERAGEIFGSPLDPQRVLVVGDAPKDITAAHAAQAIGVGVTSGHYKEDELRAGGADYARVPRGGSARDRRGCMSYSGGEPSVAPRGVNSLQVAEF
jgi:phosphoglycolate phosphatase-like HAD superfamily hydrolase